MRIGLEIKVLNNLIDKEIRSSAAMCNLDSLTNMHGRIIGYISRHENERIFQRDIEHAFSISGPSVSEILNLMEKNGLIERKSVESDRRLKEIVLTDKAQQYESEIRNHIDSVEAELSSFLDEDELAEFEAVVKKLTDKLKDKQKKEAIC